MEGVYLNPLESGVPADLLLQVFEGVLILGEDEHFGVDAQLLGGAPR